MTEETIGQAFYESLGVLLPKQEFVDWDDLPVWKQHICEEAAAQLKHVTTLALEFLMMDKKGFMKETGKYDA